MAAWREPFADDRCSIDVPDALKGRYGVESQLIQQARQREERALRILIEQHREAAFRLAYLILGDADDAEDVTQEAFIRAFDRLDQFNDSLPFRPWLLRITVNLARNKQRSIGRYWAAMKRFARQRDIEPNQPPDLSEEQAQAMMLWKAVQGLKKIDREIIYLRYFLEFSVQETSQALAIQPGTVKSRLHRAMGRLRNIIQQEFPELQEGYDS